MGFRFIDSPAAMFGDFTFTVARAPAFVLALDIRCEYQIR
jgi:hypothetical protein